MRDALPDLGVQARIGINTGEVVSGTEERLATGDAVNVAARLEQAAQPGEILIGAETLALVGEGRGRGGRAARAQGQVESRCPPSGSTRSPAPERRHETPFVGRGASSRRCGRRGSVSVDEQRCELVTVLGDAGVGKSRLTVEFLSSVDARVVRGRCLPYGEGITYWPVVEVLKQLDALPPIPRLPPHSGPARRDRAGDLGRGDRLGVQQAARRAGAAGLRLRRHPVGRGDVPRPDRGRRPAFVRRAAPAALPRPAGAGRAPPASGRSRCGSSRCRRGGRRADPANVSTVELRAKITRAAGGNPLFVTEMVAMAAETDGRRRRAADAAGTPCRPPRPARAARSDPCSSAERSKARSSTAARSRRSPTKAG